MRSMPIEPPKRVERLQETANLSARARPDGMGSFVLQTGLESASQPSRTPPVGPGRPHRDEPNLRPMEDRCRRRIWVRSAPAIRPCVGRKALSDIYFDQRLALASFAYNRGTAGESLPGEIGFVRSYSRPPSPLDFSRDWARPVRRDWLRSRGFRRRSSSRIGKERRGWRSGSPG